MLFFPVTKPAGRRGTRGNGRSLKDREIAEALQEFLRQVGIAAELDFFEWATTFTLMRGATLDYDLNSFTWFTTTADADYTMYSNYVSTEVPPASWNRWRYADPQVDEWLKAARASLDPAERAELYGQVQDQLAIDLPAIPLYTLRNALIPVVTVLGLQLGQMLGGAVLTETVFAWPGVGRLTVFAIFNRDFVLMQGLVLILAMVYVFVNLLVDLSYGLIDPRVRYQ